MTDFFAALPEQLKRLAECAPFPVYVVGGSVRDHLCGLSSRALPDYDVCAPVLPDKMISLLEKQNFRVKNVYKNTGTLKIVDCDGVPYEFSCFRSDKYIRGEHTPCEIFFTDDILLDATRRDFTCNAVYYDVKAQRFLDPLGGIADIRAKKMRTVKDASLVFSEDGLRLMRLARQAAQLGFTPTRECVEQARAHAALIDDVHPQRIFAELRALLVADEKFSLPYSHYDGLKILEETLVFPRILPELWEGKDLKQRADFHDHDVLEHSLRCVKYIECDETLRLAALLHDVGKIPCLKEQGNCHNHETVGLPIAEKILLRLQAPAKQTEKVLFLIAEHMYDMNAKTREGKLRRYLVERAAHIDDILSLKQADYSACKDDLSPAPTLTRWKALIAQMQREGVPFTQKELSVNGAELIKEGILPSEVSKVLHALLLDCATTPALNRNSRLISHAKHIYSKKLYETTERRPHHDEKH